jgi:hypothetical protein
MAGFWDVVPCSLVDINQHFIGAYCLHHDVISSSETSVNTYQTTWHNTPQDSHIHTHHRENLKSHKVIKTGKCRDINFQTRGVVNSTENSPKTIKKKFVLIITVVYKT